MQNPIIINVRANFPEILTKVPKFAAFLQQIINSQTNEGFYLEIVKDGFIYIYRDLETLQAMHPNYEDLLKIQPAREDFIKKEEIFGDFVSISPPESGFRLLYSTSHPDREKAYQTILEFYTNIPNANISGVIDSSGLEVIFPNTHALQAYASTFEMMSRVASFPPKKH